jgi:hypothetical protein
MNHLPAVDQFVGGILNVKNKILCHKSIPIQQKIPVIIESNTEFSIYSKYQCLFNEISIASTVHYPPSSIRGRNQARSPASGRNEQIRYTVSIP